MEIGSLTHSIPDAIVSADKTKSSTAESLDSFQKVFENTIDGVNAAQKEADAVMQQFAAGNLDIHTVMIEVEKANAVLQLTVQLRDKVIEAYQQVINMQL